MMLLPIQYRGQNKIGIGMSKEVVKFEDQGLSIMEMEGMCYHLDGHTIDIYSRTTPKFCILSIVKRIIIQIC